MILVLVAVVIIIKWFRIGYLLVSLAANERDQLFPPFFILNFSVAGQKFLRTINYPWKHCIQITQLPGKPSNSQLGNICLLIHP